MHKHHGIILHSNITGKARIKKKKISISLKSPLKIKIGVTFVFLVKYDLKYFRTAVHKYHFQLYFLDLQKKKYNNISIYNKNFPPRHHDNNNDKTKQKLTQSFLKGCTVLKKCLASDER